MPNGKRYLLSSEEHAQDVRVNELRLELTKATHVYLDKFPETTHEEIFYVFSSMATERIGDFMRFRFEK